MFHLHGFPWTSYGPLCKPEFWTSGQSQHSCCYSLSFLHLIQCYNHVAVGSSWAHIPACTHWSSVVKEGEWRGGGLYLFSPSWWRENWYGWKPNWNTSKNIWLLAQALGIWHFKTSSVCMQYGIPYARGDGHVRVSFCIPCVLSRMTASVFKTGTGFTLSSFLASFTRISPLL